MIEWISVKDRIPALDEDVLIWNGTEIAIANLDFRGNWSDQGSWTYDPTHWMPLPEPPK